MLMSLEASYRLVYVFHSAFLYQRRKKDKRMNCLHYSSLCDSSAPPSPFDNNIGQSQAILLALHLLFTLLLSLSGFIKSAFSLHSIVGTYRRISTFILFLACDRRHDALCKNGTITQYLSYVVTSQTTSSRKSRCNEWAKVNA